MACVFDFDAVNEETGEVSLSILWLELRNFTNYSNAKIYYGIATNNEFLELAHDKLSFNAQGDPTLESLLEVMGKDYNKEKLRESILKSVGNQPRNFNDAIYTMVSYNNSNTSSLYMLSFREVENNKVIIEVVDNNTKNKADLVSKILKRNVVERIMYYLRNAGFDVKFLEENTSTMFSSEKALKNAEGLYELITMSLNPSTSKLREDLSEVCGLLIINAMPKDALIERLEKIIKNEDFMDEFLSQYPSFFEERFSNKDAWKVIAGFFIGKQLNNEVDRPSSPLAKFFKKVGTLIGRIIKNAFNKFRKIPNKEYLASLKEAELIASEIAEGFMAPTFNGNVSDVLKSATVFEKESDVKARSISANVRAAKNIIDSLSKFVSSVKDYDIKIYKQLQKELAAILDNIDFSLVTNADNTFMNECANIAMIKAVQVLCDNFTSVVEKLFKVDFTQEADFISNMGKHANTIYMALLYAQTAGIISLTISAGTLETATLTSDDTFQDFSSIEVANKYGGIEILNLREVNERLLLLLRRTDGNLIDMILRQQYSFVKRFLSEMIGPLLINMADKVLLKGLHTVKEEGYSLSSTEYVARLLDTLGSDISWWSKSFRSMSNNPDVIGLIFDKVCKVAKMNANKNFLQDRNELLMLYAWGEENHINVDKLVERDENGPTGYIKLQVDWGRWHRDFDDMVKEAKEAFEAKYGKHKLAKLLDAQRALLWHSFFNPLYKKWHKENSDSIIEKDPLTGKIIKWINKPKDTPNKYHSNSYSNLTLKEREFIDKYMEIKARLDSKLPEGSTETARLPLILGTKLNLYRNKRMLGLNIPKAILSTLMLKFCDTFSRTANDTDYGSDKTINLPDALHDSKEYTDLKLERIPLFYINLLSKEKRALLSTDIIGSTMAYAAMVNQFYFLNLIKGAMQLSQELLKSRKINGVLDGGASKAYKRVTSFMEKELYGLLFHTHMSKSREIFAKFILMTSAFASRLFLGGNIQGGIANFNMGFFEVLKEAVAGLFFDIKSWKDANAAYFGFDKKSQDYSFLHHNLFIDSFCLIKQNKVNMFAEYFDVFGDNSREYKSYNFRNPNAKALNTADIFYHNAFMPYAVGDHYMLLIPFIALAKSIKLYYVKDGKTITTNVYDIYERLSNGEGVSNKGMLGINSSILYAKDSSELLNVSNLNLFVEDLSYYIIKKQQEDTITLDSTKYNAVLHLLKIDNFNSQDITECKNVLSKARQKLTDLTWSSEDESAFKMKAREIGNRLHGIYNLLDKVEMLLNILGNMVLAMRGYALGMIERRWGSNHYSLTFGTDVEGSELTNLKTLCALFTSNSGVTFSKFLMMLFLPLIQPAHVKSVMQQLGFSETLFYNMRRHLTDLFMLLALTVFIGGFASLFGYRGILGRDPDDDPNNYYPNSDADFIAALSYYFFSRLYIENAAYNELTAFTNIEAPSVFSLVGSNIAGLNAIMNIISGFIEGDYQKGEFKGLNKGWIRLSKFIPYFRTFLTVFNNPRKAAQSFEINRKSSGR